LRRVANYAFSAAFYQAWRRQTPVFGHRYGIVAMPFSGVPAKECLMPATLL
jgi:hypothetical protein